MMLHELEAQAAALEAAARALAKRCRKAAPRYAEKAKILQIVKSAIRGAEYDACRPPADKTKQLFAELDAKGESLLDQAVAGCAPLVEEKGQRLTIDELKRQLDAEIKPRIAAIHEHASEDLRRLVLEAALAAWREAATDLKRLAEYLQLDLYGL